MGFFRKISFGAETYGVMCYSDDMRPGQCYSGSLEQQTKNIAALLQMGYRETVPMRSRSESNKVKPELGAGRRP